MPATATLSSTFRMVIPKTIRDQFQWKAGQEFAFIPKEKGVLMLPVPELDDLAGIAQSARNEDDRDRKDRY